MKKRSAKDRILARVAELGHWPPKKQLAQEIGCSPVTVTETRRWAERQAEAQRLKNLKNPCGYCRRQEQAGALKACDECARFLTDCFALAQMTLFLRNDVHHELRPHDLDRSKLALAAIVEEWVTRRTEIEVWGDQEGLRSHNAWFYRGGQQPDVTDDAFDDDDEDEDANTEPP